MLGREKLAEELEQQATREDPNTFDFSTNLFSMIGRNLLNKKNINQDLLEAHFGLRINPTDDVSIDLQKNVWTDDVPWKQDYRVGINYNF